VRVQIDDPGRHHQTAGLEHAAAAQRPRRNGRDAVAHDAHVAHEVRPGLRVHHAATSYDDVILTGGRPEARAAAEQQGQEHGDDWEDGESGKRAAVPMVDHAAVFW
jgi:hypothetical protein